MQLAADGECERATVFTNDVTCRTLFAPSPRAVSAIELSAGASQRCAGNCIGLAFQKVVTRKDFKIIVLVPFSVVRLQKARELTLGFYFSSHADATQGALLVGGVFLMGMIMIRCPKTGQAISTGRYVEPATFRSSRSIF